MVFNNSDLLLFFGNSDLTTHLMENNIWSDWQSDRTLKLLLFAEETSISTKLMRIFELCLITNNVCWIVKSLWNHEILAIPKFEREQQSNSLLKAQLCFLLSAGSKFMSEGLCFINVMYENADKWHFFWLFLVQEHLNQAWHNDESDTHDAFVWSVKTLLALCEVFLDHLFEQFVWRWMIQASAFGIFWLSSNDWGVMVVVSRLIVEKHLVFSSWAHNWGLWGRIRFPIYKLF